MHPTGLVGRDSEVELLESFVDEVTVGGGTVLVSGEAGVGKTRLLDEAAAYAAERGHRVVRAAGAEFEIDVSFATLNQLLTPFTTALPELQRAHAEALRAAVALDGGSAREPALVSVATLALLRHVAARGSLLLVDDDLPWLDRASARVLAFVSRRLTDTHIGLLAATRVGEGWFAEQAELPRLDVQPLDDVSADALLQASFPALSSRVRRRLLNDAQGNPLALLELPAELTDAQRTDPHGLPHTLPLSRRLHAVFSGRVRALPAQTRELLLLAALEGTGRLTVLRDPTSGPSGLEALAPAERTRLVSVDPDSSRLRFRHPLTRAAVVDLATDAERRRAHTTLAGRLGGEPERRAWHLAAAAVDPDESVASLLEGAAQGAVARGDPVAAVAALVRAADLSTTGTARARRLAQAAYLGSNVTGDLRMVPRLLAEARRADHDREESLATTVAAASHLLNEDGDLDTAHRLLAGAIEMLAGRYAADDATLSEALHTLLVICFFGGRRELWRPLDAALARLHPEPPLLLRLLSMTLGDPARTARTALPELDAAIADLSHHRDSTDIVRVAIAASYIDRLGGCRGSLWRVVDDGRAGGAITSAIQALFLLGIHDYLAGQWDELDALSTEGLQLCDAHQYRLFAWPGLWLQGLVAAARGDEVTARTLCDRMSGSAGPRRVGAVQAYTAHVTTLAALGRRDFESAYLHATTVSPAGELASHVPHAMWMVMDLTEAAVHTGRAAQAAAHAAAAMAVDLPAVSPRLGLLTFGAAAMAAPTEDAPSRYDAALQLPGSEQWPFDRARIELAYGEHLRRARRPAEARRHLGGAAETFRQLGAQPWLDRASRELRATGRRRRSTDRTESAASAATLTPQQRQIAELAATGLTNKEIGEQLFLSPRTVATHLYELFPKLGITSRAALRDALGDTTPTGSAPHGGPLSGPLSGPPQDRTAAD